jgi:hypothetical protein
MPSVTKYNWSKWENASLVAPYEIKGNILPATRLSYSFGLYVFQPEDQVITAHVYIGSDWDGNNFKIKHLHHKWYVRLSVVTDYSLSLFDPFGDGLVTKIITGISWIKIYRVDDTKPVGDPNREVLLDFPVNPKDYFYNIRIENNYQSADIHLGAVSSSFRDYFNFEGSYPSGAGMRVKEVVNARSSQSTIPRVSTVQTSNYNHVIYNPIISVIQAIHEGNNGIIKTEKLGTLTTTQNYLKPDGSVLTANHGSTIKTAYGKNYLLYSSGPDSYIGSIESKIIKIDNTDQLRDIVDGVIKVIEGATNPVSYTDSTTGLFWVFAWKSSKIYASYSRDLATWSTAAVAAPLVPDVTDPVTAKLVQAGISPTKYVVPKKTENLGTCNIKANTNVATVTLASGKSIAANDSVMFSKIGKYYLSYKVQGASNPEPNTQVITITLATPYTGNTDLIDVNIYKELKDDESIGQQTVAIEITDYGKVALGYIDSSGNYVTQEVPTDYILGRTSNESTTTSS